MKNKSYIEKAKELNVPVSSIIALEQAAEKGYTMRVEEVRCDGILKNGRKCNRLLFKVENGLLYEIVCPKCGKKHTNINNGETVMEWVKQHEENNGECIMDYI